MFSEVSLIFFVFFSFMLSNFLTALFFCFIWHFLGLLLRLSLVEFSFEETWAVCFLLDNFLVKRSPLSVMRNIEVRALLDDVSCPQI